MFRHSKTRSRFLSFVTMTSKLGVFRGIIMGAPASGKGTVSERIIKQFGFAHLSCGDILRQNIQAGTALGHEANQYIIKGQLVPDSLVISCILKQINNIGNHSWLLDGFPRTKYQADQLLDNESIDTVLSLIVPHDVIIERIQGRWVHLKSGRVYNTGFNKPKVPFRDDLTGEPLEQRADDKPDTVRERLEIYENITKPVTEFFRSKGLLVEFEGNTTDEIWPKVSKYLSKKVK